jgi:hypothetical protein
VRLMKITGIGTILFLIVGSSLVSASNVEVVQVSPLTERMLIFNLIGGLQFSGLLSISGGSGNDIDFWITDPQGTKILDLGRVSVGRSFEFTTQASGAYTFHFSNTFSWFISKTVSLTYNVGILQLGGAGFGFLLILLAAIVIIAVVIIVLAIVITRGKKTSKANQQPKPPTEPQQPSLDSPS